MNVSSTYEHKHVLSVFFFMKNADLDSIFTVQAVMVKHSWRFYSYSGQFFALCCFICVL